MTSLKVVMAGTCRAVAHVQAEHLSTFHRWNCLSAGHPAAKGPAPMEQTGHNMIAFLRETVVLASWLACTNWFLEQEGHGLMLLPLGYAAQGLHDRLPGFVEIMRRGPGTMDTQRVHESELG